MSSIYTTYNRPEQRQTPAQRTYPAQRPQPAHNQRSKKKPFTINKGVLIAVVAANFVLSSVSIALAINDTKKPEEVISEPATQIQTVVRFVEDNEDKQEPTKAYALTSEQRTLIEQVVSAESRGEPYDGQVAVAQCILNACLKDGITPEEAVEKYDYTGARVEPTDSVKKAVAAVFDRGEGVTEEPILYFYAHKIVRSEWHESQSFVKEIGNHRFFKEA